MKKNFYFFLITIISALFLASTSFKVLKIHQVASLDGAWHLQEGAKQQVIIFADGYFMHTTYDKANKKFIHSRGGTFKANNDHLQLLIEFDTHQKDHIGTAISQAFSLEKENMWWDPKGKKQSWMRLDDGTGPLNGNWRITERMQDNQMTPMPQSARKTLKILSGTRFQWAAINPETKEFFGTGGGTYTFSDGKYTENIEFFSRDSSRVGASLTFDDSVADGKWQHTGLSSRGDKIHEIWSRVK